MHDELRLALERVERLTEELSKVKRALMAVGDGVPFTEAWNDELYLEARSDIRKAKSYLSRIMEHLLKLSFSTSTNSHDYWKKEIHSFRQNLGLHLEWDSNRDINIINQMELQILNIYKQAVGLYRRDIFNNPFLLDSKYLPEELPSSWTVTSLMDADIEQLVLKRD